MQIKEALHARAGERGPPTGSDAVNVEPLIHHNELKAPISIPSRHLPVVEYEPREIRIQQETLSNLWVRRCEEPPCKSFVHECRDAEASNCSALIDDDAAAGATAGQQPIYLVQRQRELIRCVRHTVAPQGSAGSQMLASERDGLKAIRHRTANAWQV